MKTNIDFKRYIKNNPSQEKKITILTSGDKLWFLNGKLHREDGPAIEWSDGLKQWYLKGELYSEEFLFLKALEGKSILFRP